jgi:hypothetical protein
MHTLGKERFSGLGMLPSISETNNHVRDPDPG